MNLLIFFVSFIYFKVAPQLFFGAPNTVLAALLMAVATVLLWTGGMALIGFLTVRSLSNRRAGQGTNLFLELFGAIGLATLLAAGAGYLIAVGFAAKLVEHIHKTDWRDQNNLVPFLIMCAAPLVAGLVIPAIACLMEDSQLKASLEAEEQERRKRVDAERAQAERERKMAAHRASTTVDALEAADDEYRRKHYPKS